MKGVESFYGVGKRIQFLMTTEKKYGDAEKDIKFDINNVIIEDKQMSKD